MKRLWCDIGGETSVNSQAFRSSGNLQNISSQALALSLKPLLICIRGVIKSDGVRTEVAPGGSGGGVPDTDNLERE